jgi:two-component system response regulator AgrA
VNPNNIELIDLKKYKVTFVNGDTADFSLSEYGKMKKLFDEIKN